MRGLFVSGSARAGIVGIVVTAAGVLSAQNYDHIPYLAAHREYKAYLAEAAGLKPGSLVEVSGVEVGKVSSLELSGDKVLVRFSAQGVRIGQQSEAAIKTKTLLGSKFLELRPRGNKDLAPDEAIDIEHTSTPYVLPDSLGDLTNAISGLKTEDLTQALHTLSTSINAASPDLASALDGVGRLSQSIGSRDQLLRDLLSHASGVSKVLSDRSSQLNRLVVDGDSLLAGLDARSAAIGTLLTNLTAVSNQLRTFVAENSEQLKPVLEKFNSVIDLLNSRKTEIQQSLKSLSQYALSLGESVAGGPFFKAYIGNLLPGQFLQPFIDAAFKDSGLDPSILGGPTYPIDGGYNSPPGTVPPSDSRSESPVPAPPAPSAPPAPVIPQLPGFSLPGLGGH